MTSQDPGALTGTNHYPPQLRCAVDGCGHGAALHAFGRRDGATGRTYCNAATPDSCACREFSPAQPVTPKQCPMCGQPMPAGDRR